MDAEHQATEAETVMVVDNHCSDGGFAFDGSEFSVDAGSSAEDGAELISPHQSPGNDAPDGDGVWSHPDSEQSPEDDIHMEDDEESWKGDGGFSEEWDGGEGDFGCYVLHFFTIRKELHPAVHYLGYHSNVGAFLSACQRLPGVQGLADLKRLHPTALPSWLALEEKVELLPYLEVLPGNHLIFDPMQTLHKHTWERGQEREKQLERFRKCRFQEGFASEGMLCNWPPLPLGVLDHLEAADLLSLSLVCKATHRASHYLFRREEEVLNRPGIQTFGLQSRFPSHWHRGMRAASLLCGRPEAVPVTESFPNLVRNLVAAPDACTQPHVSWNIWRERMKAKDLGELLDARRLKRVESRQGQVWMVDTEGWPSRDRGALAKLKRFYDGEDVDLGANHEYIPCSEWVPPAEVKERVEGVAKVFEAARELKQAVFMYQERIW